MAAIIAERGRIYFTGTGDTHTPISNKEISCISWTPSSPGDTFSIAVAGDVIAEGQSASGETIVIRTDGCINTSGVMTYTGTGTCIVYVK
jgi:hypothetical protein